MNRISLFVVLALLVGTPTAIAQDHNPHRGSGTGQITRMANAQIDIGMTKAQVKKLLGNPPRTSQNGNLWHYRDRNIQFKNNKVVSFPGAAG